MPRPVHFEIHASDPDTLVKFYTDVFGWKITAYAGMDYWLIDTGAGDGINGGIFRRRGPKPFENNPVNAFVCSLGVDSVDAYVEKALKAGGTIALPKMAIPGVGWQAYVKDPDENIVGIHQPDPSAK